MDHAARIEVLERENETLRERIAQLEAQLRGGDRYVPVEWGLTRSEATMVLALSTRQQCSKDMLMQALYSGGVDEGAKPKIVDVFICKIRKKLKPFGVDIATIWGLGYALDPATREMLAEKAAA